MATENPAAPEVLRQMEAESANPFLKLQRLVKERIAVFLTELGKKEWNDLTMAGKQKIALTCGKGK